MQSSQSPQIHEFGDFELDLRRRLLVSRTDGKPVEITGRVLEALVYLVERPGQLVEKKALIEALWPHVVVEEGNLTQTIHTLRRVLGERAGEHRYIATVPGRGYRFVADVNVRAAEAQGPARPATDSSPRRSRRWLLAAAASIALLVVAAAYLKRDRGVDTPADSTQASIAVLPFVDMSEAQDQAHFAEGLSEEILNLLARAEALRVIARTSSFSFKDQNVDIGTIAKQLAVSHVLEGSVRKSGERVRITAQLIDGATSAHIWSDTFDRDVSDIFGVQREIAAAVAEALHVTLRTGAPRRTETTSPTAYDHYLQGRHLFNRRSSTDLLQAKAHFEKALEIDPSFGRAWSALAGVYMVARYEKLQLPDAMNRWREAAERAVELAPELAEAHVRAAQYQWHAGEDRAALESFERAERLDPGDPLVLGMLASNSIAEGRLDDAIAQQKRMVEADPLSATSRTNLGVLLMMAGRFSEAQAEMERSLELSPAGAITTEVIADVLILQGRTDEALEAIYRIPAGHTRDQRLAKVHFAQGAVSESNALLARLGQLAEDPETDAGVATSVGVAIAEVHAFRNEADLAFAWLEKARLRSRVEPMSIPGWLMHENLRMTPYLKPLHADPRWQLLLDATR